MYNALIENNVLDIEHFKAEDATELEKKVYSLFQEKQKEVFAQIKEELTKENPAVYKDFAKRDAGIPELPGQRFPDFENRDSFLR